MIRPTPQNDSSTIELTPMIDIVFLLLTFFLVATTFQQTEREMSIALPEASSAMPISASLREIIVNVDAQGLIYVSGTERTHEELRNIISEATQGNPDQKVTVRGDRTTPYENIVRALDICKSAGVNEPYLDTRPGAS